MHMFHTMLLLLLLFAFSSAQKSSSATSTSSFEPTRQTQPSYVCGSDYNCSDVEIVGQPCQCEQTCILRGDCCSMTYEVCFPNVTFNDTGNGTIPEQNQTSQFLCERIGCRSVVIQALPCQCDSGCATRGDCCDDYTTACRTPPTTTTIPVDVQTATTARARNLFSTVTATQVQSPDSTAVVATTQVQSPDSTEGVATTQRPSSASSTSSAPKVSSSATPTGDGSGEHPTNATLSAPTVEAMPGCYLYGCDNRSDAHECQCDSECLLRSDCCDDAINLCAGNDTGNTTGNRMTNGTSAPTGPFTCAEIGCGSTGARCSCVSGCLIMNKCCGDYTKVCSLTTTSSPTSATLAPPTAPRLPSCVALSKILNKSACGYRAGQLCQCDRRCSVTNDCCPDFDVSICAPTPGPTTPALPTTARATTVLVTRAPTKPPPLLCANEGCDVHDRHAPCQCLPNCVEYRDCCSDFVVFCKYNGTFPPPTTSSTSSRSSITVKASTASNGTENIATATLGGIGTTRPPPAQTGSSMSSIPVSSPSGRTVESTTSRSSSSGFASSASSSSGVVITAMPSTEARTSSVETERATTTSRVSTSAEKITRGSSSLVPSSVASSSSTGGATTTPSTSSSEKATNTSPTIRSSTAPTSKEITPFSTTGRISTASSAKGTSLSPTSRVATASSGKGSTLSSTSRVSTEQATTMSPTTASRVSTASSGKRATMSPKNRGSTASSGSKGREPSSSPFLTASVPLQGSTSSSSSHPVSTSTTSSTSISTATPTKRPRSSRQVGVVTSTPSSGTPTSASSASPVTSASPSAMSASSSTVSPRQETTSARIETSTEQVDAKVRHLLSYPELMPYVMQVVGISTLGNYRTGSTNRCQQSDRG